MITLIFNLLFLLIRLYVWALILSFVFTMLTTFNVIDTRNRAVASIGEFLYRVTDPPLRPIRNLLPRYSAIDISPMILLLLLQFVISPLLGRIYGAIVERSWQPLVL